MFRKTSMKPYSSHASHEIALKLIFQGMGLHVNSGYAVSPQHAGVYPVHEALYNSWKLIWNITVTSTEEYPHFRPASSRRGFVHRNISVIS